MPKEFPCTVPFSLLFHDLYSPEHSPPEPCGLKQRTATGNKAKLARRYTGLDFNMEQEFWAVALILFLLDFFHGGTDRDGALEGNPLIFTSSIKPSTSLHPPMGPQGILFLMALQELHFHRQQEEEET